MSKGRSKGKRRTAEAERHCHGEAVARAASVCSDMTRGFVLFVIFIERHLLAFLSFLSSSLTSLEEVLECGSCLQHHRGRLCSALLFFTASHQKIVTTLGGRHLLDPQPPIFYARRVPGRTLSLQTRGLSLNLVCFVVQHSACEAYRFFNFVC